MNGRTNNIIQLLSPVTPSDTATIPATHDLILFGNGTVSVILAGDTTNTPVSITVSGSFRFGGIAVVKVRATGTTLTASQILAAYC